MEDGEAAAAAGAPSQSLGLDAIWKSPAPSLWHRKKSLATYIEQVLPKLVEVGATGSFMWCYTALCPPCGITLV